MSEYIITDVQLKTAAEAYSEHELSLPITEVFISGVKLPEIVRCRDCKHWIPFGIGNPKPDCWASGEPFKTEPDGYCAWGERREP